MRVGARGSPEMTATTVGPGIVIPVNASAAARPAVVVPLRFSARITSHPAAVKAAFAASAGIREPSDFACV